MARAMTGDDDPRIFIVEPDPNLRETFMRQLRSAGWEAEGFCTARDFLGRPEFRGIGCVVLDVRLPDAAGSDLYREMIARGLSLPVIFVSAFNDAPTAIAAIRQGAVDFLIKPVEPVTLLHTVQQALTSHAAVRYAEARREVVEERLASLTRRQREVLQLVLGGSINKQVAAKLGITLKTVKAHRAQAMRKMGVRSVAAVLHALEESRPSAPVPVPVPPRPVTTITSLRERSTPRPPLLGWPRAVRWAG